MLILRNKYLFILLISTSIVSCSSTDTYYSRLPQLPAKNHSLQKSFIRDTLVNYAGNKQVTFLINQITESSLDRNITQSVISQYFYNIGLNAKITNKVAIYEIKTREILLGSMPEKRLYGSIIKMVVEIRKIKDTSATLLFSGGGIERINDKGFHAARKSALIKALNNIY